jgi:hypothetical protein
MSIITRIALDLDDVLVDFTIPALSHATGDNSLSLEDYDPTWGWDIVLAYNSLVAFRNGCLGRDCGTECSRKEFWTKFPRSFWAGLQLTRRGRLLLNWAAAQVGRDSVFILTSPTECPESCAGKHEWARRALPAWMHRQVLIGACKEMCAQPNTLLIDDCDANCEKFRKRGGFSLLWPRPWNEEHERTGEDVDITLRRILKFAFVHKDHESSLYRCFR